VTTTNNHYAVNVIAVPNSYLDVDIGDLSLHEQYFILVSGNKPYQNVLDNLNFHPDRPKYHNIQYEDKKTMLVHDGTKQFSEIILDAVSDIITTDRELLCVIFNRFRIFLGTRMHKQHTYHLYSGLPCCKPEYKKLSSEIIRHIRKNRGDKTYPDVSDKNMPPDNDQIWSHLSKAFTRDEIFAYLSRLLELDIDLNKPLGDIKKAVVTHISGSGENKKKELVFFEKLLYRLDMLAHRYHKFLESQSSSNSDDFREYVRDKKKKEGKTEPGKHLTRGSKIKKKNSVFDDEITSVKTNHDDKIRYIGAKLIKPAKKSSESDTENNNKKKSKK